MGRSARDGAALGVFWFSAALAAVQVFGVELADYVDPFTGTAGTGHTHPSACVPFGMVQAGPDTGCNDWDYCSGYQFRDKTVLGYSLTHLSGTGGPDCGDVQILPFTGSSCPMPMRRAIDKASERASPGYYAVRQPDDGLTVEVAATKRAALFRLRGGRDGEVKVLLNFTFGIGDHVYEDDPAKIDVRTSEAKCDVVGRHALIGEHLRTGWAGKRRIAYAVEFSREWRSIERIPGALGTPDEAPRYVISFDIPQDAELLVRAGISMTGADGAKRNLAEEMPGWDFDGVRFAARSEWNALLARSVCEGSDDRKRNWYTALYHLYAQPNIQSDVGSKPFYSTFSCWDTFRAAGPLYTILTPEKTAEFVDSMLEQGKRTGFLPIWTLGGLDNQCMIGTHSVPMIVDAYLKGVWTGDAEAAYQQIKETLTKKHEGRIKEDWETYDRYGYYPFDKIRGESVSRTMECAYDDWCAAQMAMKLGKDGDAAFFMKRAGYWRNVFDPSIGMVRGKDSAGKWREPFDPFALGHGADLANDFTEGNAFQYTWHVMQDPQGLVAAMGGREKFAVQLDALFTAPDRIDGPGCVVDVTGLIGQYVHGNEPSHHVIYFYPQIGRPEKAADRIREVFDKFYLPKPDGLCGNDDCGQMSAWYLFSAMGFYPFNPCGGEYVIGAPQVPAAQVKVGGEGEERTFRVVAKGLSEENKYVKSVTLNGKPITDWKIRHADIMKGGELVFEMQAKE